MKKFRFIFITICALFCMTGCFKRDTLDNITINTTSYPITYLTEKIYGYNSNIQSIYPHGVDTHTYELTEKKLKEYSKNDMFVYNGSLDKEREIAISINNKNHSSKGINVTNGLTILRDEEELWLCPANYLMLAQNIKTGLTKYSTTTILKQEIEDNYNDVKLTISKYDAELKILADNSVNKTIIAGNDVFKFLENYEFNVLSIEENDKYKKEEFQTAKDNIENKTNSYVFILDTDSEESVNIKKLVAAGAKLIKIKSMRNLSDQDIASGINYEIMMNELIEKIKEETYN